VSKVPLLERRKYHISLDPTIYKIFRHFCRRRKLGRTNRIIEKFMRASIQNPMLLKLVLRIAEKASAKAKESVRFNQ
jgi:hypothetical protein